MREKSPSDCEKIRTDRLMKRLKIEKLKVKSSNISFNKIFQLGTSFAFDV
jgi:hypothetical protein